MKTVIFVLFFTLFSSITLHSKTTDHNKVSPKALHAVRGQLKKYAISHCILWHSDNKNIEKAAGIAVGGYFELGFHDDEEAYKAINNFSKNLECKNNIIVCCLDAIETEYFSNLLKLQDKYASIPQEKNLREDQY